MALQFYGAQPMRIWKAHVNNFNGDFSSYGEFFMLVFFRRISPPKQPE